MNAFWILAPIFVAVGVYLFWYSRRVRRMVVAFAQENRFSHQPADTGQLAATLNSALRFEEPGLTRSFDRIRDIVSVDDSIQLFRATELLDSNRYGSSENTH